MAIGRGAASLFFGIGFVVLTPAALATQQDIVLEEKTVFSVQTRAHTDFDFAILNAIDTAATFSLQQAGATSNKQAGKARSMLNFVFDTRGTDWSKEGAELALHGSSKISSEATRDYVDQIYRDDLHWQVISTMSKAASNYGDVLKGKEGSAAVRNIAQLRGQIGDGESEKVIDFLTVEDMSAEELLGAHQFALEDYLDAQRDMLRAALEKDQIIAHIEKQLLPYANRGKGKRMATKVAYSTLTMATLIPNWIAPVAETTFLATMMANGGPEQDKLLKELYLSKRLEKRRDLIEREVNLALQAREIALASGNLTLYRFSRAFTVYLCGSEMAARYFLSSNAPRS